MKFIFLAPGKGPRIFLSLAAAAAVGFFCCLGFWQLHRAEEKTAMLADYAVKAQGQAALWAGGMPAPEPYQKIELRGTYLPQALLLDNQYYQHQVGYHVLTPMILSDGKIVLIDRGWVKATSSRAQLPDVQIETGPLKLRGWAYYPSERNWALGQIIEKQKAGIAVIEKIDIPMMGQFLQKSLYPFIMRLDEQARDAYIRDWKSQIVAMPPKRHQAYAFQWFIMAFSIVVIYISLWWKKNHDTNDFKT